METIIVATIGATGLIVSAWLQAGRRHEGVQRVEDVLGEKNGHTVVEKLDSLIEWTNRHEQTHFRLMERLDEEE